MNGKLTADDLFRFWLAQEQQPRIKHRIVDEDSGETRHRTWYITFENKECIFSFAPMWWTLEVPGVGDWDGFSSSMRLRMAAAEYIRFVDGLNKTPLELNPDDIEHIAERLNTLNPKTLPKTPIGEMTEGVYCSTAYIRVLDGEILQVGWWSINNLHVVLLMSNGTEIQSWNVDTCPDSWTNGLTNLRKVICTKSKHGINCACKTAQQVEVAQVVNYPPPPDGIDVDTWNAALAAGLSPEQILGT